MKDHLAPRVCCVALHCPCYHEIGLSRAYRAHRNSFHSQRGGREPIGRLPCNLWHGGLFFLFRFPYAVVSVGRIVVFAR